MPVITFQWDGWCNSQCSLLFSRCCVCFSSYLPFPFRLLPCPVPSPWTQNRSFSLSLFFFSYGHQVFDVILGLWMQAYTDKRLESILRNASMKDKTVIITTLNDAWSEPGSIFDLFLESFRVGNQTQQLLNHLVVITYDPKTHERCLTMHHYCYLVENKEGNFTGEMFYMSPNYLQLIWGRAKFLGSVLEMGYNFLFTVYTFLLEEKAS